MILAYKHKNLRAPEIFTSVDENAPIYPMVSASLGLFLSGIITVKMLWPKKNQY